VHGPLANVGFYVAGATGMNGRLCHRAFPHALLLDELLPTSCTPPLAPEPTPDRAAILQAMLNTGHVRNRADLAGALGCSRAWVTRVLGARY